jgi:hypothetical protein
MDPASEIQNAEALTTVFGGWPSFEGAEVLSLNLEREGGNASALYAAVHLVGRGTEVDDLGEPLPGVDRYLVNLHFANALLTTMCGLNGWTELYGLYIAFTTLKEQQIEARDRRYRVDFEGFPDDLVSFYCDEIAVASVEPMPMRMPGRIADIDALTVATPSPERLPAVPAAATVREMIDALCSDPTRFLGPRADFRDAAYFLTGVDSAWDHAAMAPRTDGLHQFSRWLGRRFADVHALKPDRNWQLYIEFAADSTADRLRTLRDLYGEFLHREPAVVKPG